ncbi:MAG: LmeA family phospholipid-binding protein [Protaetiibacter sp.]
MSATAPASVEPGRRRRRRAWPWVLLGVVVLLVLAAVAADALVRGVAEKAIAQELGAALKVPADTDVEVRIGGGSVLLQALSGGLDRVDVAVDDLTLGTLTGDLLLVAEGVPLDPASPTRELHVRYAIPESALAALTPEITGVTIDDVTLEGSELVASGGATVFGATLELGLGLTPSAVEGDLAFDPTSIRIGGDTLTAEQLRANPLFGGLADTLLQPRRVCIADQLPAAFSLTGLEVAGTELVATLEASETALGGDAFHSVGVCSA